MEDVEAIEDAVELLRDDQYRDAYQNLLPVIDNCVKKALGKLGLHLNREESSYESDPVAHDLHQEARLYWFERFRNGEIDPSVDPPQLTRLLSLSTYSFIKRRFMDEEQTSHEIATDDVEQSRDISAFVDKDMHGVRLPDSLKSFDDYSIEKDFDDQKLKKRKSEIQSWLMQLKRSLGVNNDLSYLSDLSEMIVQRHYHLTEGSILGVGGL